MKDFRPLLKGLLSRTGRAKGGIALCAGIGLVQVGASLAFVWASKRTVDCATGVSELEFSSAMWSMIAVMAVQLLSAVAYNYTQGLVNAKARNKIRAEAFSKAMRSTWSGKEKFHSGDVVNRLEEDIRLITDFLCSTLPMFFVTVVQFVAAAWYFFLMAPQLAWILILIMPVAVVGSRLFFRSMRRINGEIRTLDGRIQSHMQENLQHRVLVKTFGMEDAVDDGLDELQVDTVDKTKKRLTLAAVSRAFMSAGFAAGYLVAFLWGADGIRKGTVSYGLMVAFLQLVSQVQRPVANLAGMIPTFIHALNSEERVEEVEGLAQEESGKDILLEGCPGVSIKEVGYNYPDRQKKPVLNGLSFDFKPGSFTAITGRTGAGKSTLTRLILALLSPDEGSITIYDGRTEVPASPATRCNFMYVPQGNSLMSGTIRQNLMMADPEATDEEMLRALHLADADFVRELPEGLGAECTEVGAGLSEGQAQRVAIARAALRKGGIMILDEATSSLDAATEQTVLKRLHEEFAGRKTIICITHRPAAAEIADATLEVK